MQCTSAEIEAKRLLALQKLQEKRQNKASPSPNKQFKFRAQTSPHSATPYQKPQASAQFYGKDRVITGKCSLISEERFVVELQGFSTPAKDIFMTITSRNYNGKSKNWDFLIKDHNELMSKLQVLHPQVTIEKLPNFVVNCINKERTDFNSIDLSRVEPELASSLMPFQQEGVRFGIDKNGRCLIADDMGLGKTFQALAIASYYTSDWPLLIATTSSMKNVWEETIHKYLPSVPLMNITVMSTGKDYLGDCKVLIVSHDIMSRYTEKLLERRFGVIIIDESHTIKNFKTKCTKSATELAKKAKRVVLLSGTPALSRPSELFSQLYLIDPGFFGNFFEYSRRYCDGKTTNFGWDASGKSNLQELEIILVRHFMIRRTKETVLKALPKKVQEIITLDVDLREFPKKDKDCLDALASRYQTQKKGSEKHALLLTFFSETAKIKIPSVCSYILQVLRLKQKFLVFAHHQKMLDAIEEILKRKNIKFIRIDGNCNSERRNHYVNKFQLDDEYLVALLSITAANAGITLTAAQLVIFAELHWNPSVLSQAESRAHRIGQTNPVIVKYLIAPKTADDVIWPMLQEKQKNLCEVGLANSAFHDVPETKQNLDNLESELTENLNFSFHRTPANTLDITSYFKTNSPNNSDIFDDDLDQALCEIDFE